MNNIRTYILVSIFFVLVLGGFVYVRFGLTRYAHGTITYSLQGKTYHLLTAENSSQWERGLMYYRKPVNFDGMLFNFPKKQDLTFWNKNTYMDLTLYWLSDNVVVGASDLPSIEKSGRIVTVSSPKPSNRVVELIK